MRPSVSKNGYQSNHSKLGLDAEKKTSVSKNGYQSNHSAWAVYHYGKKSVSKNGYQSNHSQRAALSPKDKSVSKNGYQSNHSLSKVSVLMELAFQRTVINQITATAQRAPPMPERFKERLSIKSQLTYYGWAPEGKRFKERLSIKSQHRSSRPAAGP